MKFGLQLPNLGPFADVHVLIKLAREAEAAGWDGFFLWDHVAIPDRMADATTVMAALAAVTTRLRLGVLVTAPSRRRPWKLAREWTTLDHLSNGRAVLGVGLGASDYDFERCGEDAEPKVRAARMDEALTIIDALWSGREVTYHGQHFQVDGLRFQPTPIQQPRIPIWVAGFYPNPAPLRRAARWDGMFAIRPNDPIQPDDWRQILTTIAELRSDMAHYDAIHSDITQGEADRERVTAYARAGVTWWLEDISPVRVGWPLGADWPEPWDVDAITARIARGPITGVE